MKFSFSLSAMLITGLIVSCASTPDAAPPAPPTDVAENRGVDLEDPATAQMTEAEAAAAQTEEMNRQAAEEKQKITETIEDPKPSNTAPKSAVPVARPVPGRDGFVFSPYNNKMINVKDFASGTMVADPTYPPAEKKYFRVP